MQTKYAILDVLNRYGIPYAQKGKSYVTRCPFCKGDSNLSDHNAEINPESGTIYCFSEQKLYFIKDLLMHFGELNDEDVEKAKEKMQKDARHNAELSKSTQKRYRFEDLKHDLFNEGYTITGIYVYRNLAGEKKYEVVRFEKPRIDGKPEKKPIPVDTDGFVGLGGKRQIPYRLEQFSLIQSDEIWLTEGEKCTDSVIANMPSSANIICLGFRKASDFKGYENLFKSRKVVIFQDNDKTGQTNTENLIEMLRSFAKEITIVRFTEFVEGYDIADFLLDFGWNQLLERIGMSEKIVKEDIARKIQEAKAIYAENLIYGKYADEKWLCKELLYTNSVCLLDAAGAAGKSFLALQLAASYILQDFFLVPELQWSRKNRKVMYVTTQLENPPEIVTNRLIQICSLYNFDQLDREIIYENFDIAYLDALFVPNPEDLPKETETYMELAKYIKDNDIQLVILDPISLFFLVNLNDNEKIPVIYRKLQETGATWLLIHHQSKATMFENTENTTQRGASALRDNARMRLTMKKRAILHMGTIATDLFIEKANFSRYHQHHIFLSPKPPFSLLSTTMTIWDHDEFMHMEDEAKKGEKERKKGNGSNKKYQEEFA